MRTVLLADADDTTRSTFLDILNIAGVAVTCAETGEKALAILARRQLSLALVDVSLGDMSGFDVLDGAHKVMCRTPIVLMAAQGSIPDAVRAVQRGATSFVEKPMLADQLVSIVYLHSEENVSHNSSPAARIVQYLTNHYTNASLTAESAAAELQLSPEHMSRVLKEQTGDTFVAFIRCLRIAYAKRLLLTTNKLVKEIAFESGFGSVHNLDKAFVSAVRSTPSEWRQMRRRRCFSD